MTAPSVHEHRRILLIDDNPAIHQDFKKILCGDADTGALQELRASIFGTAEQSSNAIRYDVDSAYQGEEALEKVRSAAEHEKPYALAFVDTRMPPGWDGLETIARIWQEYPDLQMVICTAYSDYSMDDIHQRLGRTDGLLILKKPFDSVEVSQLACTLTTKWHLAEQANLKIRELESMVEARILELQQTNAHLKREIAHRTAAEDRFRHDASHDTLTNLANRSLLMAQLEQCIERGKRQSGYSYAVLFLDIDNFKLINDSFGHDAGDKLLVEVARRLRTSLRTLDMVVRADEHSTARLGGDEFVILLDGVSKPSDAAVVAERIQTQLSAPFELGEHTLAISTSIGITLSGGAEKTADDLLREADTAMYRAKNAGKAQHAIFDEAMHVEIKARVQLESDLRKAIERNEFELFYQPIVRLDTATTTGFEALIRWRKPDGRLVPPVEFIPIAEESGLSVPIGRWVMREACRQWRAWNEQLPSDKALSMSVNVSKRQLLDPGFVDEAKEALAGSGVDARLLKLEITESVIMDDPDAVMKVLRQLWMLGIELVMDDFGTGQSSLSCLHSYPIEGLKIDRGFMMTMESNREYAAVIHAIVTLAHNLGMTVTAEGIETDDQLAQMIALDCDYAQGFLFSKPLDTSKAEELIKNPVLYRKCA